MEFRLIELDRGRYVQNCVILSAVHVARSAASTESKDP
jgi:hypothetical protein